MITELFRNMSNLTNHENDQPLNYEEIEEVIDSMSSKKAFGVDGLTADICQQVIHVYKVSMYKLYNACFEKCYFPKSWKVSNCILIPKSGKDELHNITSWRPIGLLNIFSKALEPVIINRVKHQLARNNKMS